MLNNDDPLYLMRLQAISAADQLGSVALACRVLDIPRSTFYRWRKQWLQYGREILRPRERRAPRMPNEQVDPLAFDRGPHGAVEAARADQCVEPYPKTAADSVGYLLGRSLRSSNAIPRRDQRKVDIAASRHGASGGAAEDASFLHGKPP